jgi:hypothetical protein
MFRVGFEPTIRVFHRAKTFRALEREAIVTGYYATYNLKILLITTNL